MDEILESVEGNKELLEIRGDEAGGYGDNVPSNAGTYFLTQGAQPM